MQCQNCGAVVRDGSRFCMSCGVDLTATEPDISEAATVVAPVIRDVDEAARPSTLGPSGALPGMSSPGTGGGLPPRTAGSPPPPPPPATGPNDTDRSVPIVPPPQQQVQPATGVPAQPPPAPAAPSTPPPPPPPASQPVAPSTPPAQQAAPPTGAPDRPTPDARPAAYNPGPAPTDDDFFGASDPQPAVDSGGIEEHPTPEPTPEAAPATPSAQAPSSQSFSSEDEEPPKKSKKGLMIGLGCGGCLLLLCCLGIFGFVGLWFSGTLAAYGLSRSGSAYDWGSYDYGTEDFSNVSWGQIKIVGDSAPVYSSNSTSSSVLETKGKGDKLDYYGWDDSFLYYKVKSGGADGYVEMTKAEVSYE